MKLPSTLLLSYQIEYETNENLTIDDLCTKYEVTPKQLKGHNSWVKKPVELIPTPRPTIAKPPPAPTIAKPTLGDLKGDIETFKQLAIAYSLNFMRNDAGYAEVKEVKTVVTIVDLIEKSYIGGNDTSTTVNVLMQSLSDRIKGTVDDC